MRSTISKNMKTYADYDAEDPLVKEFAKIWLKTKKGGVKDPEVIVVNARNGFVGSGEWVYEYRGNKFSVCGYVNGKGFWGTDYSIEKA